MFKKFIRLAVASCVILSSAQIKAVDLFDQLGLTTKSTNQLLTLTNDFSQDQLGAALKQALSNGVQHAVAQLGKSDGFLTNLNVRIPMPEKLRSAEKMLRSMHQDKVADDFIMTMNRAAEQAVPAAATVFAQSVQQISVADAKAILTGGTNSATQFLRRTTETNLFAQFKPIIQKATATNGVLAAYKNVLAKATNSEGLGNALGGLGKNLNLGAFVNQDVLDIDSYVTTKALDGLYKMIGEEEKAIRENPAARSTQLLQQVFGAIKK